MGNYAAQAYSVAAMLRVFLVNTLIFCLQSHFLQNKRFANVTGGDFLNMKNGGESEIQR